MLVSSGAEILAFVPVVEPSQEAAWEAYAAEHQDWLGESFVESGRHDLDPGNMPTSIQTIGDRGFIICPLWQVEPPPLDASTLLQDLCSLSWFRFLTQDTHDSNNAVMSSMVDVSFLNKEHLVVEGKF